MRGELGGEKQGEEVGSRRRTEGSTVQDGGAGHRDDIAEDPEGGGSLRRAVAGNIV